MTNSQHEFYRGLECASRAGPTTDDDPSARARSVHAAIAPLLRDTEAHRHVACAAGCSHCCHFPVGVAFAEAARLAEAIRDDEALGRRVLTDAAASAEATWPELVGRACPMLVDGACARYDDRPLPCRALASLDADACASSLHEPTPVPRDETAWWRGLGAAAALADGTDQPGTSGRRELRAAVAALLQASPSRWPLAFASARPVPES